MRKYRLLLVESSLELIPKSIWNHPIILKNAKRRRKKPEEIILDVSIHYHAIKNLSNRSKRGRPDIVHFSLLLALNSPLNLEGFLETYVHTLDDQIIFIDSSVRLPKNYNRFIGLMEQLLKVGKIPPNEEKPLLYVKTMNLKDFIEKLSPRKTILFSERGEKVKLKELPKIVSLGDAILIGGFPHGDFNKTTYDVADEIYSIYEGRSLETWTILSRVLGVLEIFNKIV